MPEIHSDFSALKQPKVLWFVRGRRSNGTRWESKNKYPTKEQAEMEMKWWENNATDAGEMSICLEFPLGDKKDD